ncbi:exopolysaccharide biosynthesis polyprenyl glycosylphosphotransferase [Streptomyces sp. GC420]|uniref:exopolysaccharide biosynthesis polyprenyl glycosylphosphotransferase n=1 Tax=Streptomyces sp. GC420 TaxID=2697568 RepID=UPI001AA1C689|nr:exopolysaccharide biosynthesis polyprenyl glycosylphosphotransferase [Streptomyces sp. GC420]
MTMDRTSAPRALGTAEQPRPVLPIAPPRGVPSTRPAPRPRPAPPVRGRPAAPLLAADVGAAALASGTLAPLPPHLLAALLGGAALLNAQAGLYRPGLRPLALDELPVLLGRAALVWCAAAAAAAPARPLAWAALLAAIAGHALLACAGRALVHALRARAAARHPRSTLVVGAGPAARGIVAALSARGEYGMRPVGLVRGQYEDTPKDVPLPVLTSAEDIHRAVIQNTVRAVVFAEPLPDPDLVRLFGAYKCALWAVGTHRPGGAMGDHLWGYACLRIDPAPGERGTRRAAKRGLDILLSGLALLVLSPVLLLCAAAVRLCDGPGVIFHQERVGRGGHPFVLLKFRSLRPSDALESATRWSVADDDRISPVGRFLRRTSLDELPQLWNVLRGDMSLVGPRPERPYFVARFGEEYPDYAARHRMPAGMTGFAQVHGLRGDTSIEDRVRFDNHYIDTWSPWQDLCVMLRTAASVFRLGGS